jgi:hypothetical protein
MCQKQNLSAVPACRLAHKCDNLPDGYNSLNHEAEPFLGSCQLCSHLRNSQHFMEPEGSLPCSQQPSTVPYTEPDQSNPYHPISLRSMAKTDLWIYNSPNLFAPTVTFYTCLRFVSRPAHSLSWNSITNRPRPLRSRSFPINQSYSLHININKSGFIKNRIQLKYIS